MLNDEYIFRNVEDAAEKCAKFLAKEHRKTLLNKDTMHSFWLQELEGASLGDSHAKKWLKSKKIKPSMYKNALMDDNRDAEKLQMDALMSTMCLPHKERSIFKSFLVDNLMKESERLNNASK